MALLHYGATADPAKPNTGLEALGGTFLALSVGFGIASFGVSSLLGSRITRTIDRTISIYNEHAAKGGCQSPAGPEMSTSGSAG